jgi:hypothetical protein
VFLIKSFFLNSKKTYEKKFFSKLKDQHKDIYSENDEEIRFCLKIRLFKMRLSSFLLWNLRKIQVISKISDKSLESRKTGWISIKNG